MANHPPHIDRVVKEKEALDALRVKLDLFLKGDIFRALADSDRELLTKQAQVMQQYSDILGFRLERFPK